MQKAGPTGPVGRQWPLVDIVRQFLRALRSAKRLTRHTLAAVKVRGAWATELSPPAFPVRRLPQGAISTGSTLPKNNGGGCRRSCPRRDTSSAGPGRALAGAEADAPRVMQPTPTNVAGIYVPRCTLHMGVTCGRSAVRTTSPSSRSASACLRGCCPASRTLGSV